MFETFIPSPPQGEWHLGFIPIHAYGLAILTGIVIALFWGSKRYSARGGDSENLLDMAIWVIPLGIIGGRVYHVATSWQPYFGENGNPWNAFKIWHGGMGIWGAVAVGLLTSVLWLWAHGLRVAPMADAVAPTLLVAQAVGRLGNYFNQELFGAPTTLPWGLEIDLAHRPEGYTQYATFHPTFLYELLWNLMIAVILVLVIEKRCKLAGGQLFGLYICGYTLGRVWIEAMRIDDANHILGLRLNIWTSILVFIIGAVVVYICGKRHYPARQIVAKPETEVG